MLCSVTLAQNQPHPVISLPTDREVPRQKTQGRFTSAQDRELRDNSLTGATSFYPLLQVLEDASVAEVVDMPAKIHQLGVNFCGHTAVGRRGEVRAAGHHAGTARWGAFGSLLRQGTKSKTEGVRKWRGSLNGAQTKHFCATEVSLSTASNWAQKGYLQMKRECSWPSVPSNSLTVTVSLTCCKKVRKTGFRVCCSVNE